MHAKPALDFRRQDTCFDPHWYRTAHPDLSLKAPGEALIDYVYEGWRQGRAPNADFSIEWYFERYPKVRAAVAAGTLAGPYHDFLLRRAQGLPRRGSPATVIVGADLSGMGGNEAMSLPRLAARAPGWDFHVVAPAGRLTEARMGANVRFHLTRATAPPIDLWLTFAEEQAGVRLIEDPAGEASTAVIARWGETPSTDTLDQTLAILRRLLLRNRVVLPTRRIDSGPLHVDPDRVRGLRLIVRRRARGHWGGGVVLWQDAKPLAELPPAADRPRTALVAASGRGPLWLTVSDGQEVEIRPTAPSIETVDIIVLGTVIHERRCWRRTLECLSNLPAQCRVLAVGMPTSLGEPPSVSRHTSLTDAVLAGDRPAVLLPAGVEPFPHLTTQIPDALAECARSFRAPTALRHADGHLTTRRWPEAGADTPTDPRFVHRWKRFDVMVLTPSERRSVAADGRMPNLAVRTDQCFTAIDVDLLRRPPRPLPALAPRWIKLDARPDGAVLGALRLSSRGFSAGGRLLISGNTRDALDAPCAIIAWASRTARGKPLAQLEMPKSGRFVLEVTLSAEAVAAGTIQILPTGTWLTRQDIEDPRPILFKLDAVRYRPPSSSPSASSRSR